ncbi:class I SAM-dependent DNA methyltransferase [Embleya sp. NPDC008237]|uniref:class I SAM-dependent DNA methyltransferase n=1 Tax=Embleya sp. NPDC008237 TaxID=3363978 RepID=UPI0036E1CC36
MTYDSLVNRGDYFSAHYLADVLPKDLKAKDGLLARWAAFEAEEKRAHEAAIAEATDRGDDPAAVPARRRTPRQSLRALHGPYFDSRAYFAEADRETQEAKGAELAAPPSGDWSKRVTELHLSTLRALGYADAHEQTVTVHRAGREHTVEVAHAEAGVVAVCCGWTTEPDAALDPDGAGRLLRPLRLDAGEELIDGKALVRFLFESEEPPRYVLLLVGGVMVLADRLAWAEGRYLAVCLDTALDRKDDRHGGELDTIAALFGADALRVPEDGAAAPLADLVDRSSKHAVGVSTELREGLRASVELIANEVLTRMREQGVQPELVEDPAALAKQLTRESLRYLYRVLFLLYAESRPELGILPADYPEYGQGYGLQRMGDLVVRDMVGERSRCGVHLYESLDLLFRMVDRGHRPHGSVPEDREADAADRRAAEAEAEAARLFADGTITSAEHTERLREAERARRAARSADVGLRFEPLRSKLFEPDAIKTIGRGFENPLYDSEDPEAAPRFLDTRLRNETLHKVLRRLMLTRGKGRERGGFISYAKLGINQLGAVYEGLMSYTGFIATEDLYEVAKGGDASGGSWMIPASKVADYPDEVFVKRPHEVTGSEERVPHPKGTFVYRLSGRDRQTSASYYTPESLTQVTVELALKHRLDQDGTTTPARELLEWTICEPALGSGAFLNEAVNQVAAEYLRRREAERGVRIDPERRAIELQKAKAYIALHNAYGVDLNATAVELAEVSLWLNTMHPGMQAPWFGLHLRRGNSLIGAGRRVYEADALPKGRWLVGKDTLGPRELPFRDGALPEGAVHHFLLPAIGWGAVAGEKEAKALAPEAAKRLGDWRKAVHKAPSAKKKRGQRESQVARLQGVARRTEYLWNLVVERLRISEREIAREVDVWGADWLRPPKSVVGKEKVLADLTAPGTPYWRLKKVMDAWCALWFWPLDKAEELDEMAEEAEVATAPAAPVEFPELVLDEQRWETAALFPGLDGEESESTVKASRPAPQRSTGTRKARIVDQRRKRIALADLDDWIDFLEAALGTVDVSDDMLVTTFDSLADLSDHENSLTGAMGMDGPLQLKSRFPWLDTVEDIAGSTGREIQAEDGHGFFHWELNFAQIFTSKNGGFDLQVGNPPWVRPEWEESAVLAEIEPWFKLSEKPGTAGWADRKAGALRNRADLLEYIGELTKTIGISSFLSSPVVYPLLTGTRPDYYRAFMCRAWKNLGNFGLVGLIHPGTHFGGVRDGSLREAAYRRLRIHAHFSNRLQIFEDVEGTRQFGVNIYGSEKSVEFTHVSWLFHPNTLTDSFGHDGTGARPGIKHQGEWEIRPHRSRLVQVDEALLRQWNRVSGTSGVGDAQAALLYPVTTDEQGAIAALAAVVNRLESQSPKITQGYNETNSKRDGTIMWSGTQPALLDDVILQGPHFAVATPFNKQPNIPCRTNRDWSAWDARSLPADAIPRVNYRRADSCPVERYVEMQDLWLHRSMFAEPHTLYQKESAKRSISEAQANSAGVLAASMTARRYTEFYRLAWRVMIPFDTERSLFAALISPGPAHVDAVNSMALVDNRVTSLSAGFWAALPLDYLLRITGRAHLRVAEAHKMPAVDPDHPLASPLLLRTLRLNCLTEAYAPLWAELFDSLWVGSEKWANKWPGLAPLGANLAPDWRYDTPLRTERERRAALVELDAIVAVWLGMTADQLVAIYTSRYPVLGDYEAKTWFDANGRKIAGNHNTYGFGQTKEHYEQFVAFDKGERPAPPEGYEKPFFMADREAEMRAAHVHFAARLQEAIDRGEWMPPVGP